MNEKNMITVLNKLDGISVISKSIRNHDFNLTTGQEVTLINKTSGENKQAIVVNIDANHTAYFDIRE